MRALAAVGLVVLLSPLAAAQVLPGMGSVVHAGDPDALPTSLVSLPRAQFCFDDADGSGTPSGSEDVFLATAGCTKAGDGEVLLSGLDAGSRYVPGDAVAQKVRPLAGTVRFADVDRDGRWTAGDALYLHIAMNRTEVTPGDVRLTRYGRLAAGSVVQPSDPDVHVATAGEGASFRGQAGQAWRFWDADGDQHVTGPDVVYIDTDKSLDVTVLDVRITPHRGFGFGTVVAAGDPDALPKLTTFDGAAWCFADPDGNLAYEPGEAVYFEAAGCPPAAPGAPAQPLPGSAVRLTGPGVGNKVLAADPDRGTPTVALPARAMFVDLDGNGAWSRSDALDLHMGPGDVVRLGDVRLTPFGTFKPGSVVAAGDSDLESPLLSTTGLAAARWWDTDGTGAFGGSDMLYLDLNADGHVGPLDVRLSILGPLGFGTQVAPGEPDAKPTYAAPAPHWSLCQSGNATLYLQLHPCGATRVSDLRLTSLQAGRKVQATASDAGAATQPWSGGINVRFFDADAGGAWSLGDTLYLHAAPERDSVAEGDVRLVAYGAMPAASVVGRGDPDLGLRTVMLPDAQLLANWEFLDSDGDGRFDGEDVAYIDTDGSGTIGALDVRLGAPPLANLAPLPAETQRQLQDLEQSGAAQAERAARLEQELEARNVSLAQAEENATRLANENARLRAELEHPVPPAPVRTPGPDAPLVLAVLAGLAGLARGRRPPEA